jgi:hypothetical protein
MSWARREAWSSFTCTWSQDQCQWRTLLSRSWFLAGNKDTLGLPLTQLRCAKEVVQDRLLSETNAVPIGELWLVLSPSAHLVEGLVCLLILKVRSVHEKHSRISFSKVVPFLSPVLCRSGCCCAETCLCATTNGIVFDAVLVSKSCAFCQQIKTEARHQTRRRQRTRVRAACFGKANEKCHTHRDTSCNSLSDSIVASRTHNAMLPTTSRSVNKPTRKSSQHSALSSAASR